MTEVEIVQKLAETESRSKSNTHRIDKLEESQEALNSLASSVAVMASEQKHMQSDISETAENVKDVKTSLDELKAKPGKRWEAIVEKVILVLVGAIVAWGLSKIGIG